MHDLIHRLAHWLGLFVGPGTGTHRAGDLRPPHPAPDRTTTGTVRLPAHRSPYCSHLPLDGGDSRLVRPYVAAHETGAHVPAAGFGTGLDESVVGGAERTAA
ncbi:MULTISPECIES: hypothetical protein [unclassified Streptomyces]|uniref:hypothetical protein n=1 Tax=unclassified Streptomyces TaxID=2593676 RepID=UPI000F6DF538|nr:MULTISPECIES: hypothetical protein [unclassified Streptomyces]AZM61758.1 hypothetical protein DLM49_21380 [Streptomyces sp. WAC 01438]RSN02211.1 hypothetical protein DMA10_00535 [Streptomyces sp. WAC 01420]